MYPTNYATFQPRNDAERALFDTSVENIIASYNSATPAQLSAGEKWYAYAQSFAQQLADDCGIELHTVAAVLAATSNNVSWRIQTTYTAPLLRHLVAGGSAETAPGPFIGAMKHKAARIVNGDFTALSGPKVVPFYHNIVGDYSLATIDRHAVRVALGRDCTLEECNPYTKDGRRRLALEAAYHYAAATLGIEVATLQAVTWCVWRGTGD